MDGARPTVVVVGGGYGGANVAKALDDVADVVLVEPKDAFQHNVAALRALVDPGWPEQIFLPYDNLLTHGTVRRDRAVSVDTGHVLLASGDRLTPDFIVLATGLAYPFPAKSDHDSAADAVADYHRTRAELARAGRVLLVGAGAVGLELAGEIASAYPATKVVLLDQADDILPGPYDQRLRDEIRRQLDGLGVETLLGSPLAALPEAAPGVYAPFTVTTTDGTAVSADLWFRCYGGAPATGYVTGALAAARDADGYLAVTPELRVAGTDTVYALGDIAAIDMNKAGVAGRQAAVVAANIRAAIEGGEGATHTPGPPSIILPLGPAGGAGQAPGREDLLTPEYVADVKGRDMFVARYADMFGIDG